MIDAHVHFWRLNRGDYEWISPERKTLHQDYLPHDFFLATKSSELTGCIAVQAAATHAETEFLLSLAAQNDWILGVTGWTDLASSTLEKSLDAWATSSKLKAIRPMAAMLNSDWLNRAEYQSGIKSLAARNLTLEALVLPRHLGAVAAIAKEHPDLQLIINHAAKPEPADLPMWQFDLRDFSQLKNVNCKLSGLTQQSSELGHHQRVFDTLLNVFEPSRLIWGSDYPVLLETSNYGHWLERTKLLLQDLSSAEIAQITVGTANRVYRLNETKA